VRAHCRGPQGTAAPVPVQLGWLLEGGLAHVTSRFDAVRGWSWAVWQHQTTCGQTPAPASYISRCLDVCACSSPDDLEGLLRLAISEPAGATAAGPDSTTAASPAAAAAGGISPSSKSRGRRRGQRGLTFEALLDDLVVLSFLVGECGWVEVWLLVAPCYMRQLTWVLTAVLRIFVAGYMMLTCIWWGFFV
jgi:hypothetical protein